MILTSPAVRLQQTETVSVDEDGVILPNSRGNCFAICIACIFGVPLDCVPPNNDTQGLNQWLQMYYPGIGIRTVYIEPTDDPPYQDGLWIASVESPRFKDHCTNCGENVTEATPPHWWPRSECPHCHGTGIAQGWHAVIYDGHKMSWDPHPNAKVLDGSEHGRFVAHTTFFVRDPSRLVPKMSPRAHSSR